MGKFENLEKLKELKESGVLTEIEFEMEKHKILNSNDVKENVVVKENVDDKKSKQATTGFILGLSSIIAWFIPLIGFPVTILGIIFSAMGINSNNKGKATAGLILSLIFFVVTLINSVAGAIMGANLASSYYYY